MNAASYALFILSGAMALATITATLSVDVIKNWKLTLPPSEIHAGQTIVVQSEFTKLKAVKGIARRSVECVNIRGVYLKYLLNEAVAEAPPGRGGIGMVLKMPTDVPNLPTKCRISVNVDYQVYPWRTVTEFVRSADFDLLPPLPCGFSCQETTETSQSPALAGVSSDSNASSDSSSQSAPNQQLAQQDSSQPDNDGIILDLPLLPRIHIGSPL